MPRRLDLLRSGEARLEQRKRCPPVARGNPRTASASTALFMPVPKGDQAVPFQRAILLALTPPAVVKSPPATSTAG